MTQIPSSFPCRAKARVWFTIRFISDNILLYLTPTLIKPNVWCLKTSWWSSNISSGVRAIQHHFLSHIFPNAPLPTVLISNTNWLVLLCLIISSVKHKFSSPLFSQHYSPLSHLSTFFPWLSSFSMFYFQPQAPSLYLTSFSPRLHFLMNSKVSRRSSSSLLYPNSGLHLCLSSFLFLYDSSSLSCSPFLTFCLTLFTGMKSGGSKGRRYWKRQT